MQEKKHPRKKLENFSKIFMQLGLVLALFVVYVAIEQKTFDKGYADLLGDVQMIDDLDDKDVITIRPEPKLPKPKPVIPDDITVVDDDQDIEEIIPPDSEGDEDIEIVDINDIQEEDEPEEIDDGDVDFVLIEDVPIFPGCKGNKKELKDCFNKKMQKHFVKKFDSDLPNELGLPPGKKRLIMLFKIDRTGKVVDIRVKAPHPKLEKEASRIMKLLPTMKPGRQRGRAVGVKYTLPMRINVE